MGEALLPLLKIMPRTSKLNAPRTVQAGTARVLVSDATQAWAFRRFRNTDASASVFWGDVTVTASSTAKGQELKAGEILEIDYTSDRIYMITASGTVDISVVEVG
jgi:hypothetical protein